MENIGLNFSPTGLFPTFYNPQNNLKCVIVAEVIEELSKPFPTALQSNWQHSAETRYKNLSLNEEITLDEAILKTSLLHQKGISLQTAKMYWSFRLSTKNAEKLLFDS